MQYCEDIKSLKMMSKMFQNEMYWCTHNADMVVFSFPILFFLTLSSHHHQHKVGSTLYSNEEVLSIGESIIGIGKVRCY
jgi:hypothetical protein